MTFFDWLVTPDGMLIVHATTGLLVAIAAYLSYLSRRQLVANSRKLDEHITEHVMTPTLAEPPPGSIPAAQGTRAAAQPEGEDPGGAR